MTYETVSSVIYRMTTPYKDIFTTVYAVRTPEGVLIFDAASFDCDIREHLLFALEQWGIAKEEVRGVFISHNHRDHAGGLPAFAEIFPSAVIFSRSEALKEAYGDRVVALEDGEAFFGVLRAVTIPGHTLDSAGVLDTRTHTLISGDCLQLYGIFGSGKWASNIGRPSLHLAALDKLEKTEISEILTAHDYHPYGYRYVGAEAVRKAIQACREPLERIREMIAANPDRSDEEIAEEYNAPKALPTLGAHVVTAVRKSMN